MQKGPIAGFALSLIAGMLIILNASLLSLLHIFALFFFGIGHPFLGKFFVFPWFPLLMTVYGAICGIVVLLGSYFIYKGKNILGGVLVILFSILSLPVGGGFIIGFLLGVIGGALASAGC